MSLWMSLTLLLIWPLYSSLKIVYLALFGSQGTTRLSSKETHHNRGNRRQNGAGAVTKGCRRDLGSTRTYGSCLFWADHIIEQVSKKCVMGGETRHQKLYTRLRHKETQDVWTSAGSSGLKWTNMLEITETQSTEVQFKHTVNAGTASLTRWEKLSEYSCAEK